MLKLRSGPQAARKGNYGQFFPVAVPRPREALQLSQLKWPINEEFRFSHLRHIFKKGLRARRLTRIHLFLHRRKDCHSLLTADRLLFQLTHLQRQRHQPVGPFPRLPVGMRVPRPSMSGQFAPVPSGCAPLAITLPPTSLRHQQKFGEQLRMAVWKLGFHMHRII